MDKRICNKGFVLIELLIVIAIIVCIELLILPKYHELDFSHLYFIYDYLQTQSEAIKSHESKEIEIDNNLINFNESGNVNNAVTINFKNHDIVVNLGGGRIEIKS